MKTIRFVRVLLLAPALCALAVQPCLHAATAPHIDRQPASQSVTVGDTVIFTVAATGTEPLRFQWRKGAANIAGATNASFTITNAQFTNAGSYTVVVSNGVNPPATSTPAILTVTPAPTLPEIVLQPSGLTVAAGGTARFFVGATGYPPPTYQWVFGMGTNGMAIAGATNATLLIKNVSTNNAGLYCCLVRNTADYFIVSEMVSLTVVERPVITGQPASQSVVSPVRLTTNDLTDTALAGKTLLLRIGGGAAPFATNGGFAVILSASEHTYSVPASGATPESSGHWSISEDVNGYAVLRLDDSLPGGGPVNVTLLTNGRYEMTPDGPGGRQNGSWAIAGARPGPTVNFTVTTGGSPATYQWLFNGKPIGAPLTAASFHPALSGPNSATLTISNATATNAGRYSVIVSNLAGKVISAAAALTVNGFAVSDTVKPVVTITSPPATRVRVLTNVLELSGTARDRGGMAGVFVQLRDGDFAQVPGTTNWFTVLNLQPGTNIVRVKAVDHAGQVSAIVTRTFFYVVPAALRLTIVGEGVVAPNLTNRALDIGRNYQLAATPKPRHLFSNWIAGGVIYTNPVLDFAMRSNLAVTANFITNPFLALKGAYTALFSDPNTRTHESAGSMTFTLTDKGAFSGRLLAKAGTLPLSGQFGLDLTARKTVGLGSNALAVMLQLAAEPGYYVTGAVSSAATDSAVQGHRAVFSAANPATNFAGKYTALFYPQPGTGANAFGQGFAAIDVSRTGQAVFSGALPDGSALNQSARLGPDGQAGLYVPLYGGKGSVFGWVSFLDNTNTDVTAMLSWTKKGGVPGPLYPSGLTNGLVADGSLYVRPGPGTNVIRLPNAQVILAGGGLDQPLIANIAISAANAITVAPPNTNQFALTLQPANGLFTGRFVNPATRQTNTIRGAVLPRRQAGGGFFLNATQSGEAFLGP